MLLVHPDGEGSKATNEELNISFDPVPDYSGIAKAASSGKCFAGTASTADELQSVLLDAVAAVKSGRSAVVDARLISAKASDESTKREDCNGLKRARH